MKRAIAVVCALIMVLTLFSACSTEEANGGPQNGPSADAGRPQELDALLLFDVTNMDPHFANAEANNLIANNVYSHLMRYAVDTGELEPDLAERWEVSQDNTEFTFYLHRDAKFHNGDPVKASDVVFSFERAKDSPYLTCLGCYSSSEALDDYTVRVTLTQPYAPFLMALAAEFRIASEAYVNEAGEDISTDPMGSGPFKMEEFLPGDRVVLTRFEEYYLEPAELPRIVCRIITDPSTVQAAFETGELDYGQLSPAGYEILKDNDKVDITMIDSTLVMFICMNNVEGPFADVRVRRALNLLVDRQEYINLCEEGMGTPTSYLIPSFIKGFPKGMPDYEQNIEEARALMAEAGYPDGFTTTIQSAQLLTLPKIATVLQQDLAKLNITAEIEQLETNTLINNLVTLNYEISVCGGGMTNYMDSWRVLVGTQGNFCGYQNTRVDELFDLAAGTADEEESSSYYREMMETTFEDCFSVPLYVVQVPYPLNKNFVIKRAVEGGGYLQYYNIGYAE